MLRYLDTIIAFAVIMLGLSLVIMLMNQMLSSLLSYRGSNLRWGIETMLKTLNKEVLGPEARKIADQVLTHPMVSDSIFTRFDAKLPFLGGLLQRWKLASAIGPDTLVRTLKGISAQMREKDPKVAEALDAALDATDPAAERKLTMVKGTVSTILSGTNYGVQVNDLLRDLGTTAHQSVGKVEAWFNVIVGRVSQRFTMQMRIWTIIFAFLLSFGIHLDSFDLISELLANPTTVQNLVNQSGAMLAEAEAVLGNQPRAGSGTGAATVSPQVLGDQMKELLKEVKPEEATPALSNVPSFRTLAEAEIWLSDNLKPEVKPERKADLVAKYKGLVVTGLSQKIRDINRTLKETGIQIIPDHEHITGPATLAKFVFTFKSKRNLLGIFLTSGLLALGAPFWYNRLKDLTNLRPSIATGKSEQKEAAA